MFQLKSLPQNADMLSLLTIPNFKPFGSVPTEFEKNHICNSGNVNKNRMPLEENFQLNIQVKISKKSPNIPVELLPVFIQKRFHSVFVYIRS